MTKAPYILHLKEEVLRRDLIKVAEDKANDVITGLNRKLLEGKSLIVRKAYSKSPHLKSLFISKKWREKAPEKG